MKNGFFYKLFKGSLQIKYENRLDGSHAPMVVNSLPYFKTEDRVEQLMTINGDGTGTKEMADGTGVYFVAPPAGEVYVLHRMNVYMEETQSQKFDAAMYGSSTTLAGGIVMTINNPDGVIKMLTPQPIQKIGHWNLLAGAGVFFTDFPPGKSDMVVVRWTFHRGGGDILLNGDEGESLQCVVIDPLGNGGAGLASHLIQVQGRKFSSE